MENIGTTIMFYFVPTMLDFIALKDLGKYKLNIQVIQLVGALCTPEIFEKIGDGFRKHDLDAPEVLSAYGLNELSENLL